MFAAEVLHVPTAVIIGIVLAIILFLLVSPRWPDGGGDGGAALLVAIFLLLVVGFFLLT